MSRFVAVAVPIALAFLASADADCTSLAKESECTNSADGCLWDKGYRRRRKWVRKPSCFENSCSGATSMKACSLVTNQVCSYSGGACTEVTDCSAAANLKTCERLTDCTYDKGYRRMRKWIRKPSCFDTPASCAAATTAASCNAVTSEVCKYSSTAKTCTEVTDCSVATGAGMCGRLSGCSYDKGYKRGRRWIRKPSCFDTPASCTAATTAASCSTVTSEVCKYSSTAKTCIPVTDCKDGSASAEMCGRIDASIADTCIYDKGVKGRRRWIRKPSCVTLPTECADAKTANVCDEVQDNCAMISKKCTLVSSCGQAINEATCNGVGTCGTFLPGKWTKVGRRKRYIKPKCPEGPTDAPTTTAPTSEPTTAAPTTTAPTSAPTELPMTKVQCRQFDGNKADCQSHADRACVWNVQKIDGAQSVKDCTREDNILCARQNCITDGACLLDEDNTDQTFTCEVNPTYFTSESVCVNDGGIFCSKFV